MTALPDQLPRVPFNRVNEAVHVLETEAEPWSVQLEVRVTGTLDAGRLGEALTTAMELHPMARARKAPTSRRSEHRYAWEITPEAEVDPLRVLDCPDKASLDRARIQLQSLPVPLVESPPFRVRLLHHPDGDFVMLNMNHAASDGFGSLHFLRSVGRAYAGEDDQLPGIDPLKARDLVELTRADDLGTRLRRAGLLLAKLWDLVVPPARLAYDGPSERPGYGFHHVRLSGEQTASLTGSDRPGTVNDLLLAALHVAIDGWNQHGATAQKIGTMVPINMRPEERRQEVMANLLLPVRVVTNRSHRVTPGRVQETVRAQTRRFKEMDSGAALIELLNRSPALPLGAKEALSPLLWLTGNRLVDTAMLSNLGRLERPPTFGPEAGDTTEVWFSAPARMPLGLSLGAVTVAGRLHLAFRYRHALLDHEAAARFADRYLSVLMSMVSQ